MNARIKQIEALLDKLATEERILEEERTVLMNAEALKHSKIKPGQIVSASRGRGKPGRFRVSKVEASPYCDSSRITAHLYARTIRKDGSEGAEVSLAYAGKIQVEK